MNFMQLFNQEIDGSTKNIKPPRTFIIFIDAIVRNQFKEYKELILPMNSLD